MGAKSRAGRFSVSATTSTGTTSFSFPFHTLGEGQRERGEGDRGNVCGEVGLSEEGEDDLRGDRARGGEALLLRESRVEFSFSSLGDIGIEVEATGLVGSTTMSMVTSLELATAGESTVEESIGKGSLVSLARSMRGISSSVMGGVHGGGVRGDIGVGRCLEVEGADGAESSKRTITTSLPLFSLGLHLL